jgi:hypothetical protein
MSPSAGVIIQDSKSNKKLETQAILVVGRVVHARPNLEGLRSDKEMEWAVKERNSSEMTNLSMRIPGRKMGRIAELEHVLIVLYAVLV